MAQALVSPQDCCVPCPESTTTDIPGPQGDAGDAGDNGTNGKNAFTTLTAQFTMPGELSSDTAEVADSSFAVLDSYVFVQFLGWLQITAIPDSTHLTLKNLADTPSSAYLVNAPPATNAPIASRVMPTGPQGPAGSNAAGALFAANNLVDVANTATSRTNLGLGTAATKTIGVANTNVAPVDDAAFTAGEAVFATAAGIESKSAANSRTALGLGTMAVQAANAVAISGGTIAGITDLTVADGGTGASNAAGARANLGVLRGYGIIGSKTGVDLNVPTNDNAITMLSGFYIIDRVMVSNPGINTNVATAGLFTAAGGAGTTLAADQSLAALNAAGKYVNLALQAVVSTDVITAATLYFRSGTAQGAADTCDVSIFGWRLD